MEEPRSDPTKMIRPPSVSLGAAARTQLKDIGIIRELTDGVADNQVFEAAARIMQELVESGGSELDHSAAVQVVERRTGVSLAD